MAKYGEVLIAITNGSRGTQHMIDLSKKEGLKVYIKEYTKAEDYLELLIGEYPEEINKPPGYTKLF